jgi:2-iminobutanoate/2-iminopropanoate deaminase
MQAVTSAKVKSNPELYSQAIVHGDVVYVSGQVPKSPETGEFVTDDFPREVRCALENTAAVLAAAGATFRDVLRVTVYLSDLALFDEFNAVYVEAFSHRPLPARTTIGAKLVRPELRVELDVIAAVPAGMTGEGE